MTQKEANIIRKGILKAGYKINVLYSGPSSLTIRLMKKSTKTWTMAFRGSSEKAIMQKLSTVYPLDLSKKDAARLKKLRAKAHDRKLRKEEEAVQLEASVAEMKEEDKRNRQKAELRSISAAG